MSPACFAGCLTGLTVAGNSATLVQTLMDLVDRFRGMLRRPEEEIEVECPEEDCHERLKQRELPAHVNQHRVEDAERIRTEFAALMDKALKQFREERAAERALMNAELRKMMVHECAYCDEEFHSKKELKSHLKHAHWGGQEPKIKWH